MRYVSRASCVSLILFISVSILPSFALSREKLSEDAIYTVLQAEADSLFRDHWEYCISIEGQDPSIQLQSRLRKLYDLLTPVSECEADRPSRFDVRLVELVSDNKIKVVFDCYAFCKYTSTYTLEVHGRKWAITNARYKMQ